MISYHSRQWEDHDTFYSRGGVHRDVSSGNIIIMPVDDGNDTTGRLIDLDHAKVAKHFMATNFSTAEEEDVPTWKRALARIPNVRPYSIDNEVMIKALQVVGPDKPHHSTSYIDDAITMRRKFFDLGLTGRVTPADLHWDKEVSTT
jgi:Fungal protein kinase